MRDPWPCGRLVRWLVRSVRARAAEKAGEGRRGAERRAAVRRVGRAGAERGVAGVAVAPPPPAAQPGGTPSVTWRPHGSPREARGPRDPGQPPGRAGCQSGHSQGVGPGRRRSLSAALLRGRGSPAQPVGRTACCLLFGLPASSRRSPRVVICRIPGWAIRHPTHPTLRKVELLLALSSSSALAGLHSPLRFLTVRACVTP